MDKGQYDGYRQGVYNEAAAIVDKHDAYKNAGQLNAQALAYFINELDSIMASFKATTDAQRRSGGMFSTSGGTIEASWLDPRFHDYYDFFTNIAAGWRRDLAAMPPEVTAPPIDYTQPTPGAGYVPPSEPSQGSGWTLPGVTPAPSGVGGGGTVTVSVPTLPQPPILLPGVTPAPGAGWPPVGSQGPFGGWITDTGGGIVDTVSEMSPMMLLAIGLGLYLLLGRRRG